jgi:cell division protein ZapA
MSINDGSPRVVTVEIQGLRYPIRSSLDPAYIAELSRYVDAKLQAAADETPTADSVRVAVLAALNIADEFFRAREHDGAAGAVTAERALALERLVDTALALALADDPGAGPALATPPRSD